MHITSQHRLKLRMAIRDKTNELRIKLLTLALSEPPTPQDVDYKLERLMCDVEQEVLACLVVPKRKTHA